MPNYNQYPMPYMPYPYPQQMQMPQQAQSQQNQNSQPLQNAGFVLIPTEEDAYRYPVALGKCMTFKVENEPIVIEKSMSFSQLENPRIDRYRLVREDVVEEPKPLNEVEMVNPMADELKDELQAIRQDLEGIKKKLYSNNSKPIPNNKKREVEDDE